MYFYELMIDWILYELKYQLELIQLIRIIQLSLNRKQR